MPLSLNAARKAQNAASREQNAANPLAISLLAKKRQSAEKSLHAKKKQSAVKSPNVAKAIATSLPISSAPSAKKLLPQQSKSASGHSYTSPDSVM